MADWNLLVAGQSTKTALASWHQSGQLPCIQRPAFIDTEKMCNMCDFEAWVVGEFQTFVTGNRDWGRRGYKPLHHFLIECDAYFSTPLDMAVVDAGMKNSQNSLYQICWAQIHLIASGGGDDDNVRFAIALASIQNNCNAQRSVSNISPSNMT